MTVKQLVDSFAEDLAERRRLKLTDIPDTSNGPVTGLKWMQGKREQNDKPVEPLKRCQL